jgi:predicted GIY-YIG superfamily endonuclease
MSNSPARFTGVYLLHFETPYKHARHYLGWSGNVPNRVRTHKTGYGTGLTRAVHASGIEIVHVRTWPKMGRFYEQYLRSQKNNHLLCPICNPHPRNPKPRYTKERMPF